MQNTCRNAQFLLFFRYNFILIYKMILQVTEITRFSWVQTQFSTAQNWIMALWKLPGLTIFFVMPNKNSVPDRGWERSLQQKISSSLFVLSLNVLAFTVSKIENGVQPKWLMSSRYGIPTKIDLTQHQSGWQFNLCDRRVPANFQRSASFYSKSDAASMVR